MHIIEMTYDDVPVKLEFGKSGLIIVKVGSQKMLLYRAYMKTVMENVATMAYDATDKAVYCPDCGAKCPHVGTCIECEDRAF